MLFPPVWPATEEHPECESQLLVSASLVIVPVAWIHNAGLRFSASLCERTRLSLSQSHARIFLEATSGNELDVSERKLELGQGLSALDGAH